MSADPPPFSRAPRRRKPCAASAQELTLHSRRGSQLRADRARRGFDRRHGQADRQHQRDGFVSVGADQPEINVDQRAEERQHRLRHTQFGST